MGFCLEKILFLNLSDLARWSPVTVRHHKQHCSLSSEATVTRTFLSTTPELQSPLSMKGPPHTVPPPLTDPSPTAPFLFQEDPLRLLRRKDGHGI